MFGGSYGHHTARFYRCLDPGFYDRTPSFAILRDPIARFVSSYSFIANRGGDMIPLYPPWAEAYGASVANVDDFIAAHRRICGRYRKIDYVMRPQSEFVTDGDGRVMVDHLFLLGRDDRRLRAFLADYGVADLPVMNRTERAKVALTPAQEDAVRELYPEDFELVARGG